MKTKAHYIFDTYSTEEVKEILGYYDGSNEDDNGMKELNQLQEDSPEFLDKLHEMAETNGNFEHVVNIREQSMKLYNALTEIGRCATLEEAKEVAQKVLDELN
jgi:hypothetical protein